MTCLVPCKNNQYFTNQVLNERTHEKNEKWALVIVWWKIIYYACEIETKKKTWMPHTFSAGGMLVDYRFQPNKSNCFWWRFRSSSWFFFIFISFHFSRYYLYLMPIACFLLPTIIPMYFWGETFTNAWFVATMFRWTFILNVTWLVNSAAHKWGDKPYDV